MNPDYWWRHAACAGRDRDMFYDPYRINQALAICHACKVREPCLRDDLSHARQPVNICGVRGGLTERERRALWRRGRRAAPERSEAAEIDAANYTELELLIAGYLSTQPPHDREHPTLRLPTARRVLEIIGEWEPIDSFAPGDLETTP